MSDGEVCWVCNQVEDRAQALEVASVAPLTGVAPGGICVRCGLEVIEIREDPAYLARVKRFVGAQLS